MAQSSWPFENVDTSETQFSQWARNIGEGIKIGAGLELEPFGDASGLNVKVKSGEALIRGHYYNSTAQETLTIAAADLTNPRIDRVVLKLDPTANSVVLTVLTGTPDPAPSAPALTQSDTNVYELSIATVAVAANATAISAGNVTDTRGFLQTVASVATDLDTLTTTVGTKVEKVNGTVTTAATGSTVVRNITLSTSDPSGGSDGAVWLKYTV
tara:strand:- start:141 stop:779 length:639 start_codon:yes stop_codon:yes gene_type:complete